MATIANGESGASVRTKLNDVIGNASIMAIVAGTTVGINISGSAATLTTPRNINGTAFDGSANITVTAAAGTLTGTTLNATVVTSSLTSVGTLTSGTLGVGFTTVAVARGGTGVTTFGGAGTLLFTSASDTLTSSANLTYNGTTVQLTSDTSNIYLRSLVGTTSEAAVYLNNTPGATNYALRSDSTATTLNTPSATTLSLAVTGTAKLAVTSSTFSFTPGTTTSGATTPFLFTAASRTAGTAGANVIDVHFDLGQNLQHANGAVATQFSFAITPRTYTFVSGTQTITDASTFYINGAPKAGTSCAITNSSAAWFVGGALTGAVTNGYAATFTAPTGATNNFAAQFIGGKTMFPAGTTGYAPLNLAPGVAPTSPVDGDVYYINTNDRFMVRKNATDSEIISASAVTTEAIVSDTSITVTFNGVTYKLLARA